MTETAKKAMAGSAGPPKRAAARLLLLVTLLAFGFAAVAGGRYAWHRWKEERPPAPPTLDLDGYDHRIVGLIERARAEVVRSPRSGVAWGLLGSILKVHNFHREAMACYDAAEKLQPQEPSWPYLGGILRLREDPQAALAKIRRACEVAGDAHPVPRLRLALLLLEQGQFDEAERHIAIVLRHHPKDSHALLARGKLELGRGRLAEALKFLTWTAANSQTAQVSEVLIAGIQQRLGNTEAAEEASRRAAALPKDPPLPDRFLAGTAQFSTGLQTWLDRGDRSLKEGRIDEGVATLAKAASEYPDSAIAWQTLGWGRIQQKDFAGAETALRKSLELAENLGETHFELGLALFSQGKHADAAKSFERSIELRGNHAAAHYDLGLCYLELGRRSEAIEAFRAATQYQPHFADAYKRLGANLGLEQRFGEAIEPLRRAVELNPADFAAAQMLERAILRAGEPKP